MSGGGSQEPWGCDAVTQFVSSWFGLDLAGIGQVAELIVSYQPSDRGFHRKVSLIQVGK